MGRRQMTKSTTEETLLDDAKGLVILNETQQITKFANRPGALTAQTRSPVDMANGVNSPYYCDLIIVMV